MILIDSLIPTGKKPPAATTIPSPSFLSTSASTPCAAYANHIVARERMMPQSAKNKAWGVLLKQLADSLPSENSELFAAVEADVGETEVSGNGNDSPAISVLRDWISQEVERQWASRQARELEQSGGLSSPKGGTDMISSCSPLTNRLRLTLSPTTPHGGFEETILLPQSVWQGLRGQSPLARMDYCSSSPGGDGQESPTFAQTLRTLLTKEAEGYNTKSHLLDSSPAATGHVILRTIGELTKTSYQKNLAWPIERPPMCRTPFS